MKKAVEQRKNGRLQVSRDAFVALGPDDVRVGQIIDISMDGLAFRCFGSQEPSKNSIIRALISKPMRSHSISTCSGIRPSKGTLSSPASLRTFGVVSIMRSFNLGPVSVI